MFCYHTDRSMLGLTHSRVVAYEFQYVEIFQLLDKPVQLQVSVIRVRLSGGVGGCGSKIFTGERGARKRKRQRKRERTMHSSHSSNSSYSRKIAPFLITFLTQLISSTLFSLLLPVFTPPSAILCSQSSVLHPPSPSLWPGNTCKGVIVSLRLHRMARVAEMLNKYSSLLINSERMVVRSFDQDQWYSNQCTQAIRHLN